MLSQFPQDIAINMEIEEENQLYLSGLEAEQGSVEKIDINNEDAIDLKSEDAMDWKPEDARDTSSS